MHAPYDRGKISYRTEPKIGVGFLILIAAVAFVVIGLAALDPKAAVWISQAAEAEFVGDGGITGTPTQIVQPDMAMPVQTVRAY